MFFFFGPLFLIVPFLALVAASRILTGLFRRSLRHPAAEDPRAAALADRAGRPQPGRLEGRIFSLAYRMGGRLTVSDVVIDTGLGVKDAEALLDRMTDEVRVRLVVDEHGLVRYEFPEIIDRLEREKPRR